MARTRATAVSAMLLTLGLSGIGAVPFVTQSATASVTVVDPADPVEPCDVGEQCEPPETTVTITTTLPTPTPETEQPETTITKTVTASPTKKAPKPKPSPTRTTSQAPTPPPPPTTQSAAPQPLPTQTVQEVPSVPVTSEQTPEDTVVMPSVATTEPLSPPPATDSVASETDPVQLEVRNAAPEYDQRSLTQQLSIPALILVLLVLFAVLIFEGRLRRMAHAAAVRKAGPQAAFAGHPGYPGQPDPHGYPAGPGYATAGVAAPGYPGGTAYAPIISFVPVQTYPSGQVQYGAVYQEPGAAYGRPGHVPQHPAAPQEPVVLQPDQTGAYTHQPATHQPAPGPVVTDQPVPGEPGREPGLGEPGPGEFAVPGERAGGPEPEAYRAPFEPLVPPAPSADVPQVDALPGPIPPGGANPYGDGPEWPLAAASAAEPGDPEPWEGGLVRQEPPRGETPSSSGGAPSSDGMTVEEPRPGGRARGRRRRQK